MTHVTQGIWSLRYPLRLKLMSPACSHNIKRVNNIPLTIQWIVDPSKLINLILSFIKYLLRVLNSTYKHAYKIYKKHFWTPYPLPLCVCGFNLVILSALSAIIQSVSSLIPAIFHPLTSTSLSLTPPQVEEISASIKYLTSTSPSRRIKYY